MTSTNVIAVKNRRTVRSTDKAGRPRRATKYDWESVRAAYVEGVGEPDHTTWPTLKEVAEKFDIPYVRVREQSASGRWAEQKQVYITQIEAERQKERSKQLAKDAVQFDASALDVAKLGMSMVHARLKEIAEQVAFVDDLKEKIRNGEVKDVKVEDVFTRIKSSELDYLGKSALSFQQLGQRALGTDTVKADISVTGDIGHTISVTQELMRDDPDRLAGFLRAAERSGVLSILDKKIIEGHVVEGSEDDDSSSVRELESGE